MSYPLLDTIHSPADLRRLDRKQLPLLAEELRAFLIDSVSQTGGHLSSNLGTVELTIALHAVFDTPEDRIVWDVGHQCYPHKVLTGRREGMGTLRMRNGVAGFPKRCESPYDTFGEIPRSFAIDRNQRQIAQVFTAFHVEPAYFVGHLAIFVECGRRKLERQIVLAQRNLDLHPRICIISEDFNDATDRFRVLAWLLDDLNHHNLARRWRIFAFFLRWHQDVLGDALVFGNNDDHPMFDKNTQRTCAAA